MSRVSPVQAAPRNCTRDEGGPFGFGDREPIPSYRKLRMNLVTYRDLKAWLDWPFETPPTIPMAEQLTLSLPGLGQPLVTAAQEASTQNPAVRGTVAL